MNDDLDKHLADAMGAGTPEADKGAERPARASKQALRTPALVAEPVISEPVPETFEEMKLRAKLEALQELLAEQHKVTKAVKQDTVRAAMEAEPEEKVDFTVNLPVQATNIRVDGREYYHGHTYKIRKSQQDTFRDIQAMAWRHDDQVRGYRPHADGYRTNNVQVNAQGQAMSRPIY